MILTFQNYFPKIFLKGLTQCDDTIYYTHARREVRNAGQRQTRLRERTMSTATTTTRTVLVITDASGSWGTTDLTESQILDLIERAAERYYRDRDDVTQFDMLPRLEQYSTVQLPADYDKADSKAITDLAWTAYCDEPEQPVQPVQSRGKAGDIIVNSTEVCRHNGQCEYGLWMPLDEQTEDVIEAVVDEVLEARCRDCRREEHEDGNTEDAGRVTIGGQIWVYRR